MHKLIQVVYEHGVFRPVKSVEGQFQESQRLTVTVEAYDGGPSVLADGDPTVSLEAVRAALSKVPGTLAKWVQAEREER